jgi:hypothetical protein
MARSDTLLTGSIMAMLAMVLVFDDENGPAPSGTEGEPEEADVSKPPTQSSE